MSQADGIRCPACGGSRVATSAEGLARCEGCGEQFFVQGVEGEDEAGGDSAEGQTLEYQRDGDEAELSELRIRSVTVQRRGALRERSYWIIGAVVFLVASAKLGQMAWVTWTNHLLAVASGDLVGAVAALMMFVIVATKVRALTREIAAPRSEEPAEPPDFSKLGDGSQRVKDLETIVGLGGGGHDEAGAEAGGIDVRAAEGNRQNAGNDGGS